MSPTSGERRAVLYLLLTSMLMNRVFTRAPECTADDFNYEYTSCDASGERWRVAVPRPGRVCEGNVPFPQKGLNCSFSCSGGQYLDLKTQECRHCQAGSYSLGGGVRFEDFTDLPQGFQIENFALDGDEILAEVGVVAQTAAASTDCAKNGGWHVKDGFLIYVPTPCFSKLSYSGHLVRPGFVEYVYRMPKNNLGLVFNVIVKNEQCQSYRDQLKALMGETRDRSGSSKSGANGEWQTGRLELKSGPNVISWTVANSRESAGNLDPIVIGHIDVHGIAFTKSCTLCPAGTYSSDGATECTPCQPDHYSKRGTPQSCPKCPDEQYSGPKASSCIDRPKCTESDYYAVHEPCVDGKTKKSFKSVQPKVCRDDLPGAVKQPHSEPPIPCPKCNPGMHLNKEGACVFCDKDQYSDGNECTKCPVNTVPNYGYQYVWWNSLPPNMKTNCEFIDEESTSDCNIGEAWLPDGESIHTAPTHQPGVALELALAVPHGFKNPLVGTDVRISAQNPIGHLTFVFETRCATKDCALYFVEDSAEGNGFYRMVADFNGTVLKRAYTHPITRITGVKYMWAFLRSKSSAVDEFIADRATIYSINVTNAVAGGASACLPCPTSANPNKGCVPCEPGHYMTESTHICTKCPKDTMLNTTGDRIGVKSCIECGDYLASNDGVACTTDGNLLLTIGKNETRKYDMSALGGKRTYEASGVKVYSREGTSYYHMFNVSLFGGTATCRDTYDYKGDALIKAAALDETTEAAVCRMTVLPLREGNTSHMIYVSPMGLVSRLIGISHKPEHQNIRLGEKELDYDGNDVANRPSDVHFFYDPSPVQSEACPQGQTVVITARCDPALTSAPQARLPRSCPDGTCDGCLYHILILSAHACPICTDSDYTEIRGECIAGFQSIHSIPAKHCILSGKQSRVREEPCTVFGVEVRIMIGISAAIAILLCALVIVVFRRNRRLEYKYMKLIEAKAGSDGMELPAAESCGLEEDENENEDDGERVIFAKGKKGFFSGGGGGRSKNRRTPMDTDRYDDRAAFVALEDDE